MFACLMPLLGMSQDFSQLSGGRSAALSHSSVALADPWSICHNQAAMTGVVNTWIGASYEKRYFLNDINLANLAVTQSVGKHALGFCFSFLGFDSYYESKLGLAYAHSFGTQLSAGLKFSYDLLSSPETGRKLRQFNSALGVFIKTSDKLHVGVHLNNINSVWRNPDANLQPMAIRLGLLYRVSEELGITAEAYKQLDLAESIRGGMEYQPGKILAIRLGLATAPFRQTLGMGYCLGQYQVDLSFEYMHVLGGTTNLSLQYELP